MTTDEINAIAMGIEKRWIRDTLDRGDRLIDALLVLRDEYLRYVAGDPTVESGDLIRTIGTVAAAMGDSKIVAAMPDERKVSSSPGTYGKLADFKDPRIAYCEDFEAKHPEIRDAQVGFMSRLLTKDYGDE